MGKLKKQRRPKLRRQYSRSRRTKPSPISRKLRAFVSSSWKIVVGISVLMSVIGTVYAFGTRVSVSPEPISDRLDPYRSPFVITNDSYLPLSDVAFSCRAFNIQPNEVVDEIAKTQDGRPIKLESTFGPGDAYVPFSLEPNEKRTFECLSAAMLLKPTITNASVEIVVTYRPLWILWKQERRFRFDAQANGEGKISMATSSKILRALSSIPLRRWRVQSIRIDFHSALLR